MDFSFILDEAFHKLQDEKKQISYIMKRFAELFPFENIDILRKKNTKMTEQFLYDKFIKQNRGGLCYELNGLLYLVLKQLHFPIQIGAGTVWSEKRGWSSSRTHTLLFWHDKNDTYIVDSGFGYNLALSPLKIDGEAKKSQAGSFRIRTQKTEAGSFVKEKLVDGKWEIRYAFELEDVGFQDLQRVHKVVQSTTQTSFSKDLTIAQIDEKNNRLISINEKRVKITSKDEVEEEHFQSIDDLLKATEKYVSKSIAKELNLYLKEKGEDLY